MMETFWGIISLLLVVGLVGTIALLFYFIIGGFFAVRKATKQANVEREKSRAELESSSSDAIRSQLLNYNYFTASLRATPTLQNFLSRIENKEEKLLASEYSSEKRIYQLLNKAEREAGYRGRPECLDYYHEIFDLLRELARRA
jgi:hypothetical protein